MGNYSYIKNQKRLSHFTPRLHLIFFCLLIIGPYSKTFSQEYFQQEVKYKINVSLNDQLHQLSAVETLIYINHSPDTLHFLYFHLWPNAYSNNNTPLARQLFQSLGKEKLFKDEELRGSIDSLNFEVNGRKVDWELLPGQPDICKINLMFPLISGDSIFITTPFRVKIPKGITSRLGHIGESYQISQWYPKPAVYDKDGWHPMSYLDQGEFYSEFGSFDVSITLPDNYIVGATGNLQNPGDIEILKKLAAETSLPEAANTGDVDFPASSKEVKTLRYTGDKIHDFAWFADKRFHVRKGNVKLPNSERVVTTMVLFTNEQSELWKDALQYVEEAIFWFSETIGDYPYQNFTAVQSSLSAGDGMEYPGITVIGQAEDAYSLDEVISHEICHNWFYSALGSNERRYPFMDESITSSYTERYMNTKYPGKKLWEVYIKNIKMAKFFQVEKMPLVMKQELEWLFQARSNLEQPINLPADKYANANYVLMLYNKAATSFNYLRNYLGDSEFDAAMHEYFVQWKSSHPQPEDLRNIFETQTGKDLSWFFTDLMGTTKRLDYKMVRIKDQQLLIKNKGELISPLNIAGLTDNSVHFEKWEEGFKGKKWIDLPSGAYSNIIIDPGHVSPEIVRTNNNIKKNATFPRVDPLQTQLLFSVVDPERRILMYLPVINWTRENGFMAGMSFHNSFIIPKPLEYFVMPFYAFGNSDLAGSGQINYNITPYNNFIRLASISIEGTQFGAPGLQNYRKLKTGLELHLRNKKMDQPLNHSMFANYIAASNLFQIELEEKAKMNSYLQFGYFFENSGLVNPYTFQASFETGKKYQKISTELNYKISYFEKNSGLDIRVFAGILANNESEVPFYSFSPGGRSGREQYFYQGTYPDRFTDLHSNFWSRQMTISEGGLVSPVNDSLGYSRWLFSMSFTSNLPGIAGMLPVKPFLNVLLNDHGELAGQNSPFFYEAGVKAGIWGFFEIYIPLLVSKNMISTGGAIKNRIRFVFSLDSFTKIKLNSKA